MIKAGGRQASERVIGAAALAPSKTLFYFNELNAYVNEKIRLP
jgi:hypothetical protein